MRKGEKRLEGKDPRIRGLEQEIDDLAAENRDLRAQLDRLVAVCERVAEPEETAGLESTVAALAAELPASRRAKRGPLFRAAKAVVRGTIGVARRLWQASDPRLAAGDEMMFLLSAHPVAALPRLSFVVRTDEVGEGEIAAIRSALQAQTDSSSELVLWDATAGEYSVGAAGVTAPRQGSAATAGELLAATTGEFLVSVASAAGLEMPTTVEQLRWLLACEGLRVVRLGLGPTEGSDDRQTWVVHRELWRPRGVDGDGLRRMPVRKSRPVLGKVVPRCGRSKLALPEYDPLALGSPGLVRQVEQYIVAAGARAGEIPHRLYPLHHETLAGPRDETRPAVLILLASPLTGGVEQAIANLLGTLSGSLRFLVVALPELDPCGCRRIEALSRLAPEVYELGRLFPSPLRWSVLEGLITARGVRCLLNIGAFDWLGAHVARLRQCFPKLRIVDLPLASGPSDGSRAAAVDLVLAPTARSASALAASGSIPGDRVMRLPAALCHGPTGSASRARSRVARIRAELGVPAEAHLVTMAADLVADTRPEDFVALARRFAGDEELWFLLLGEGELASGVRDLARFLSLERFVLARSGPCLGDVLDVTDVACTTSQSEPFPHFVLAAAAAGTPVVAAAVDDIAELLATPGVRGAAVAQVGDLAAYEAQVREMLAGPGPGRRAARVREALEEDRSAAIELVREVLAARES